LSKKAIIGIAGSLLVDPSMRFKSYWKSYVNDDYVASVVKAGGVPYIIPVIDDDTIIKEQVENIDGIIFSGGSDINPLEYGEKVLDKCGEIDARRDKFDFKLAKIAKDLKKPTLCICRGHQVNAVLNNGTLYQDLSYIEGSIFEHDQYSTPDFKAHQIKIDKDSLLYDILRKKELWVNSFHHQAIKDVPKIFKVTAVCTDGVVEAIEYKNPEYFFLSVQWHPEMMATRDNEDMLKLFKRLIKESK
jgi:putative glutamine amidotransferase